MFFASLTASLLAAPALAQDAGDDAADASDPRAFNSDQYPLSLRVPEPWQFSPTPPPGILVAMRPQHPESVEWTELRVSPRVPERLRKVWLGAMLEALEDNYATISDPADKTYGSVEGQEFLLASRASKQNRLVAFVFYREDTAYTLVMYASTDKWAGNYRLFGQVAESLELN